MLVFLYLFLTRQPLVIPCPAHTAALLNRGCPFLYSLLPNKKRLASRLSLCPDNHRSEREEPGDGDDAHHHHQQGEGHANAHEIHELVIARPEHQGIDR